MNRARTRAHVLLPTSKLSALPRHAGPEVRPTQARHGAFCSSANELRTERQKSGSVTFAAVDMQLWDTADRKVAGDDHPDRAHVEQLLGLVGYGLRDFGDELCGQFYDFRHAGDAGSAGGWPLSPST
jgi:hypothetical protein